MADLEVKAAVRSDRFQLFIDGDQAPIMASLELPAILQQNLHKVRSLRTGSTTIVSFPQGHSFDGVIVFQQSAAADLRRFNELDLEDEEVFQPAVGTQMTTHVLRFHDPDAGDADLTGDIFIFAAVFLGTEMSVDGEGNRQIKVPFHAQADASGNVWGIGDHTD